MTDNDPPNRAALRLRTPRLEHLTNLLFCLSILLFPLNTNAESLEIERLTWSGIKLVANNTTVLVDPVGTDLWDGKAPEGLVPVEVDTRRRYALITHAHNDHFDRATLQRLLKDSGTVIVPAEEAVYVASRGLPVLPAALYASLSRGGFSFTAVPASDGLGDVQVSWVITAPGGQRIFHGGDTLWHGHWQAIGQQYGPFDVAFLPINGARLGGDPPQETPFTLTPEQAVDAALILRAKTVVPIHFGLDDPPNYVEVKKPLETLRAVAERRGVTVRHLKPGETFTRE